MTTKRDHLIKLLTDYKEKVKEYGDTSLFVINDTFDPVEFLSQISLFFVNEENFKDTITQLLRMKGITITGNNDQFMEITIDLIKTVKSTFKY
jgi:hypothetical protein